MKISWIGPWVSRIDWCEGHWCGSTYMAVRLSDISSKTGKNTKNAFLACFWAYVGQPHGHIGWAIPMPFASFKPTNPRTNPWNFGGICSAFDEVEKLSFFESAILNFFSKKNNFFFASSPWKLVTNYMLEWMGLNFYYYDGLQPKIRAGIINEHECRLEKMSYNRTKNVLEKVFFK